MNEQTVWGGRVAVAKWEAKKRGAGGIHISASAPQDTFGVLTDTQLSKAVPVSHSHNDTTVLPHRSRDTQVK